MSTPANDLKKNLARSQQNLVDFLRVDLDLAFTILNTAKIEKHSGNTQRMAASLEIVRKALQSIRHLAERVQDETALSEIQAQANVLEAALTQFKSGDRHETVEKAGAIPFPRRMEREKLRR